MVTWGLVDISMLAPETSACTRWVRLPGTAADPADARRAGLAANPAAPDEILLGLTETTGRLTMLTLAYRRELPPEVTRRVAAIALATQDPALVGALVEQGRLDRDEIAAAAGSASPELVFELAFVADPPAGLLDALARHPMPLVRYAVACRPSLPRPLVELLAADPDLSVRDALAGIVADPPDYLPGIQIHDEHWQIRANAAVDLPADLLPQATADPHPAVRAAAAGNPRIGDELLARLAADPMPEVRLAAAASRLSHPRPATPPHWQARLAGDPDPQVRLAATHLLGVVGSHAERDGDRQLLHRLADDLDPAVRGAAKARLGLHPTDRPTDEWNAYDQKLNLLEDLLGKRALTVAEREWLASRERFAHVLFRPEAFAGASEDLLRRCAASEVAMLRCAVACAPGLPEQLALQLAADPDPRVRGAYALYRSTVTDVLRLLATLPDVDVEALAANPRTPGDVLSALPGTARRVASDPLTPAATLAGLSTDPDTATRLAVAANPACPAGVLAAMAAAEPDPEIARVVCGHPALPVEAMRRIVS